VTFPQNLHSAVFLDKILDNVRRDLPTLPAYCAQDIRGVGADDVGYVDFVKIAFCLFGLQIRALYYFFFLLYGLTLFWALIERQNDRMGQIFLLGVAGLIYVSCYYSDLLQPEPTGSGNMLNPRFIPVLALVPGFHLLLMMVARVPPNWWRLAIVFVQTAVIFFAIHIRLSAVWWVPTILLAAVILFLLQLRDVWGKRKGRRSTVYRALMAQWPAWITIIVILVGVKAVAWSLHPVYRQGGWLQHHALWQSIYYSLQFNPRYVEKYGAYYHGKVLDDMPIEAALVYLQHHPEADKPDIFLVPGSRALKYAAVERLDRLALFEFVQRDPWFVFETFFIVNTKAIWNNIIQSTETEWSRAGWRTRLALILAIGLISAMAVQSQSELQRLSKFTAIVSVGAIVGLSIPILTVVTAQTMADQIMVVQLAIALLLSLTFAFSARAILFPKQATQHSGALVELTNAGVLAPDRTSG
jgi:hypothetical protein